MAVLVSASSRIYTFGVIDDDAAVEEGSGDLSAHRQAQFEDRH
mgnify:CR=1 FL=1